MKGTEPPPIDSDPAIVLFGRTRRRVLGWLLGHSDQAYYLRQIARYTDTPVGAARRELEQLTAAGLVSRRVDGRQVYFQANRQAPIFPDLESLFAKTAGLTSVVREALAPLADRIEVAFVFGSAARGGLRAASDIDLFVVGDVTFEDVAGALGDAQPRLGRDVNPTVYPPGELRAKLRANHHFVSSVLKEPRLFIIGGHDELVGMGAKRLADKPSEQSKRDSRSVERRRTRPGQRKR